MDLLDKEVPTAGQCGECHVANLSMCYRRPEEECLTLTGPGQGRPLRAEGLTAGEVWGHTSTVKTPLCGSEENGLEGARVKTRWPAGRLMQECRPRTTVFCYRVGAGEMEEKAWTEEASKRTSTRDACQKSLLDSWPDHCSDGDVGQQAAGLQIDWEASLEDTESEILRGLELRRAFWSTERWQSMGNVSCRGSEPAHPGCRLGKRKGLGKNPEECLSKGWEKEEELARETERVLSRGRKKARSVWFMKDKGRGCF